MRAPIARRLAPVAIGHADEVVRRALIVADRLDRAVDRIHAVPRGRRGDARRRIEGRRHAPGARIGLGKTYELRSLACRARDEALGVCNIVFGPVYRMGDRLHNGDAECHLGNPSMIRA